MTSPDRQYCEGGRYADPDCRACVVRAAEAGMLSAKAEVASVGSGGRVDVTNARVFYARAREAHGLGPVVWPRKDELDQARRRYPAGR